MAWAEETTVIRGVSHGAVMISWREKYSARYSLGIVFGLIVTISSVSRAATPPVSEAGKVDAARKSADPAVRKAGGGMSIGFSLGKDFASADPQVFDEAVGILRANMKNNGRWCQDFLKGVWLEPLLATKRYDLIQEIIDQAFADPRGFADLARIEDTQAAVVDFYLAQGKDDQALAAAKTYYDFCRLDKTQDGISLFAATLANTKLKEDKDVIQRFKQQQAVGAEMKEAAPDNKIGDLGTNLLSTIKIDPTPFASQIKAMEMARKSYDTWRLRAICC